MGLLSLLLALAFGGMLQGVGLQSRTDTQVSIDSNLRRVMQIVTQDLRNMSYGMVSSTPYASGASSISVALATDNAVHPVMGPASGFQGANTTQILLPSATSWPTNSLFALVHSGRQQATILKLTSALSASGAATLQHNGQTNTVCWANNNFVQRVETAGYSYDSSKRVLYRATQNDAGLVQVPLAFNVSAFTLSYVTNTGSAYTSPGAIPPGQTLSRIAITVSVDGRTSSGDMRRSLNGSVEIPKLFTLSALPMKYVAPGSTVTCT